jgi:hypothetical protein
MPGQVTAVGAIRPRTIPEIRLSLIPASAPISPCVRPEEAM